MFQTREKINAYRVTGEKKEKKIYDSKQVLGYQ